MYISEREIFNPVPLLVFQRELKRKRFKKRGCDCSTGNDRCEGEHSQRHLEGSRMNWATGNRGIGEKEKCVGSQGPKDQEFMSPERTGSQNR